MTQRSRNWCFTLNNYEDILGTDVNYAESLSVLLNSTKYIVVGLERAPETGTPHLQGYVDFINPRTLGGLHRKLRQAHWEIRRGTFEEASEYCKKSGLYQEHGTPNEQGKRNDLYSIRDEILQGKKVKDILLEDPNLYHQYGRTLEKLEDVVLNNNERTEMTRGIWLHGETGVGKSHTARIIAGKDRYIAPKDKGWWDNYSQQESVIIEDYRGHIPYDEMLQMVDKYEYSVSRRARQPMCFNSKQVIITSPLTPEQVYKNREKEDKIEQLHRRFIVCKVTEANSTDVAKVILDLAKRGITSGTLSIGTLGYTVTKGDHVIVDHTFLE